MSYFDKFGKEIPVDTKEVMDALQKYLRYMNIGNKQEIEESVATEYLKFIDILESAETAIGGDILSHLKSRELFDRPEGDYLTDPIAGLTTGEGLGSSYNAKKGLTLEVKLGLDVSGSMADADGISRGFRSTYMTDIGRENSITIAPRLFFASMCTRYIDKALSKSAQDLGAALTVESFTWAAGGSGEIVSPYNGEIWMSHPNAGGGTYIGTLLEKFRETESWSGSPNAHRLDLIITDGQFWMGDYEAKIQYDRLAVGGSVQTVILNICGYEMQDLPDTFVTYPVVSPQVLVRVIQQVVQEFLQAH